MVEGVTMGDEEWPHLWDVGGDGTDEYWTCSCGQRGTSRDPDVPHSWDELWFDVRRHLVEVGQVTEDQAGSDPMAGRGKPGTNPLHAFRLSESPDRRRQARLDAGIPSPAS